MDEEGREKQREKKRRRRKGRAGGVGGGVAEVKSTVGVGPKKKEGNKQEGQGDENEGTIGGEETTISIPTEDEVMTDT